MKARQLHYRAKCPMLRSYNSKSTFLSSLIYLCLGGDKALDLLGKSLSGDFLGVVSASVDPNQYTDPYRFRADYLACSLMSAFPSWDVGIDRDAVALRSFLDAEKQCSAASTRLQVRYVNGLYSRVTPESVLHTAREKIARLLGSFSWADAEPYCCFGPGATVSLPRRRGDSYYKFGEKPCVTPNCAVLAYAQILSVPRWYQYVVRISGVSPSDLELLDIPARCRALFNIVRGNSVTFVPKNALKSRTIAIEPTLNGWFQHGIGGVIRSRLRRVGIDLNDQSKNQRLALLGSISGSLATIDMSHASDSLSLELCAQLLPPDWYEAICLCRSECGVLPDGTFHTYSKVSSMGCGFTFELESLIFWAIASSSVELLSLTDRTVSVYGDDIIIPVGAVPTVTWLLDYVGFTLNKAKSFWSGPFRESCGKHYFRGVDVTPFYIREDISSPASLILLANNIRRWSRLSYGLDTELKPVYDECRKYLPASLSQPSIPDGYGDYALFGDFDEVLPSGWGSRRSSSGHEGFCGSSWVPVSLGRDPSDEVILLRALHRGPCDPIRPFDVACALQAIGVRSHKKKWELPSGAHVNVPTGRSKWKYVKFPCVVWPSFGPWLG